MITSVEPSLHLFRDDEPVSTDARAALRWAFEPPRDVLSSAPVGGGWRSIDWILNVGVSAGYARTDLDAHAREVAVHLGCSGAGQVLLTAADVSRVARGVSEGVRVDATVGITKPTWAADEDDTYARRDGDVWVPGTINLVVQFPVALTPAAAVNAVATATEAKTQALLGAGVPGTGTASDAVTIVWPSDPMSHQAEPFAGPRSRWGARLARAVHQAVVRGIEAEGSVMDS